MKLTRKDREWLNGYRKALVEQFPGLVKEMLIYGSKARGEARPDSDLDVLLIVHDNAGRQISAMRDIGYALDPYCVVIPSIMAYTEHEWEKRRKSDSPFRQNVERDKVRVL